VDMDFFNDLHKKATVEEKTLEQCIYRATEEEWNIGSDHEKARMLFEKLRYPRIEGSSTDRSVMKELIRRFHPEQAAKRKAMEDAVKVAEEAGNTAGFRAAVARLELL